MREIVNGRLVILFPIYTMLWGKIKEHLCQILACPLPVNMFFAINGKFQWKLTNSASFNHMLQFENLGYFLQFNCNGVDKLHRCTLWRQTGHAMQLFIGLSADQFSCLDNLISGRDRLTEYQESSLNIYDLS